MTTVPPVVADFWHPPSELHNLPCQLISSGRGPRALRPPRFERSFDAETTAERKPDKKTRRHAATDARIGTEALDTCARDANRIGHCRFRGDDGAVIVRAPNPQRYGQNFEDDARELCAIELKAADCSSEQAWLDDEKVDFILIEGVHVCLVPRAILRMHIMRRVPLTRPTRSLNKSLYKLCAPLGPAGPWIATIPTKDAADLLPTPPPAAS